MSESTDVALIAGVVGGIIALLAVIGVAVAVGLWRRRKSASSNELPMVTTTSASNYGVAPPPRDASSPVRTSEYGPISARGEYASMRADSDYADAVNVKGGSSSYGAFTPAEGGGK